jgi:hypothetical protein
MYTYAVIVSTEKTGPMELYRGTDGSKARDIFHAAAAGMIVGKGLNRWSARCHFPSHGHCRVDLGIVCEACDGVNGVFTDYCGHCGADTD